jgi:electron transport complex protein RnfA
MAMAVVFVTIMAAIFTWTVFTFVLKPFGLEFLQTLSFILIIASLVQLVEIVMKKQSRVLYNALGVYLPLITTNCAVFGACVLNTDKELEFMPALVTSFAYAIGFGLALVLFAGVRERILLARVPKPLQDTSIALVTAGIISLSFYAFKGMV